MNNKKFLLVLLSSVLFFQTVFSQEVYEEINLIESKKRELIDYQYSGFSQEDDIRKKADEEYRKEAEKIDEESLRIAQKDANGRVLTDVQAYRNSEKLKIKSEIDSRTNQEIQDLRNGSSNKTELLQEIYNLQDNLKKERVSYLEIENKDLFVDNYSGDLFGWYVTINFKIGEYQIFNERVFVDYESVSDKKPQKINTSKPEDYEEYLDIVDNIDEYFRNNQICCEIDYIVEACPSDLPSTYKITINNIYLLYKLKGNNFFNIKLRNNEYLLRIKPAIDIRSEETKSSVYKGNKTLDRNQTNQNQETNSVNLNKTVSVEKNEDGFKGRSLFGVSIGFPPIYFDSVIALNLNPTIEFNLFCTYPISKYLFMEFDFEKLSVPYYFGDYNVLDSNIYSGSLNFGVNTKIGSKIDLYASTGLGLCFDSNMYKLDKNGNYIKSVDYNIKFALGFDYLFSSSAIVSEVQCNYIGNLGFSFSEFIGFSFRY